MLPEVVYANEIVRRLGRKVIKKPQRHSTPAQVLSDYESMRREHLREFEVSDWPPEEYALREPHGQSMLTIYTVNGREAGPHYRATRQRTMDRLAQTIGRYSPTTVSEAGSGTGRNLVWLAHTLGVSGTGLELTPSGVEAGRLAASRYGLDLTFEVADLLDEHTEIPAADVVFSVHALEQIPHPEAVVEKMLASAKRAVVMIEPFPDYWPRGMAGYASRLRAQALDRLRPGVLDAYELTSVELLPFGTALNRSVEVVIEKS